MTKILYKDIPVGLKFYFGNFKTEDGEYIGGFEHVTLSDEKKMCWVKINELGDCIMAHGVYQRFDHPFAEGLNATERGHGTVYYPDSDLYRWMHSDNEWYVPKHCAYKAPCPGFLTAFTEKELELIEECEYEYQVPAGYTRKNGTIKKMKDKFWIAPSNVVQENFDWLNISRYKLILSLGSSKQKHLDFFYGHGGVLNDFADRNAVVPIMTRIKPETELDLNSDTRRVLLERRNESENFDVRTLFKDIRRLNDSELALAC